jgi:hypothetical protein
MKSIALCISRFDEETKEAFLDLYSKVDENVNYGDESTTDEDERIAEAASLYEKEMGNS